MKKKYIFSPPGERVSVMVVILFAAAVLYIIFTGIMVPDFEELPFWYSETPRFMELIRGKLSFFWMYAAVCAAIAVQNYRSFNSKSRSGYVMKQIKSAAEKHVMCLSVPVLGIAAGLMLTLLMILNYRSQYTAAFGTLHPADYYVFNFWRALI